MIKYISIILVSLFIQTSPSQDPGAIASKEMMLCDPENNSFQGGEEITYKIYYNLNFIWLSAGEVKFKVEDLGDQYKFSARGRTFNSYEWLFKADDYFESIVDKKSLLPVTFQREIKENKYRYFEKIKFDQPSNQMTSWTGKTEETAKETTQSMDGCIRDVLAIVYAIRTQKFESIKPGSSLPINVVLDNKKYNLGLNYIGTIEDKRVHKLGKYRAYHLSPQTIAGTVFKENDRMHIWASTDQNKIPLLIESPVAVGSIKAVLTNTKGLKYPFDNPNK